MTNDQLQLALTDREHVAGRRLPTITDDYMHERLTQGTSYIIETKPYTLGLLRTSTNLAPDDAAATIWEHMRRMMALMADAGQPHRTSTSEPDRGCVGNTLASLEQVPRLGLTQV